MAGGNKVANQVNLYCHEKRPYQSLRLKWNHPEARPNKYKICVHKFDEATQNSTQVSSFDEKSTKTETEVDELDQLTTYFCSIVAIYRDGTAGEKVESNLIKTDECR